MANSAPYSVLTGVGTMYIAAASTAMPALTATPGASWRAVGETEGGVKVSKGQNIEKLTSDQRTGATKAIRTEESLMVETNLVDSTLENLANAINGSVTTVAASSGVIGKKSLKLHKGAVVEEFALLFRGNSAYGNFPSQYYVPRGFITDDIEQEFVKDDKALIPFKFDALEDLNAATEDDRFGVLEMQTAAAL